MTCGTVKKCGHLANQVCCMGGAEISWGMTRLSGALYLHIPVTSFTCQISLFVCTLLWWFWTMGFLIPHPAHGWVPYMYTVQIFNEKWKIWLSISISLGLVSLTAKAPESCLDSTFMPRLHIFTGLHSSRTRCSGLHLQQLLASSTCVTHASWLWEQTVVMVAASFHNQCWDPSTVLTVKISDLQNLVLGSVYEWQNHIHLLFSHERVSDLSIWAFSQDSWPSVPYMNEQDYGYGSLSCILRLWIQFGFYCFSSGWSCDLETHAPSTSPPQFERDKFVGW